jgi:hypothetical protein
MLTKLKALLSVVAVAGVAAVGVGTFSAFTSTTGNSGSSIASADVNVTDDDGATVMFSYADIRPGWTATKCINVTNAGPSALNNLAFYAASGGSGLAGYLTVDIDRGTGATGGTGFSCTGFTQVTADLVTSGVLMNALPSSGSPVNDATGWTNGATKSYRIQLTLPGGVAAAASAKTGTLALTWDAS